MKYVSTSVDFQYFQIILFSRYVVDQLRQYKNEEITQWSQSFLKVAFIFYPAKMSLTFPSMQV